MFVHIDPIAVRIVGIEIRWYGIFFVGGLAAVWTSMRSLAGTRKTGIQRETVDSVMFWISLAVVIGGRLGNMLFYEPEEMLENPALVLHMSSGGMSFHGGLIAVAITLIIYTRFYGIRLLSLCDITAASTPAGLFWGRLGNFLNGELYGPTTRLPWGIKLDPNLPPYHPTQLYEAGLEGALLFALLYPMCRWGSGLNREGLMTGAFLVGYGIIRIIIETLRVDNDLLTRSGVPITVAQLLSIPMCALGAYIIFISRRLER